ncbi:uncharacterized protein DFL_003412 [Arthrobotrys flagrans]|uniref:Uncharacterized protein n=1 Tax=Arthrobotrys flagrans TaxID=97331 RepID=A0A437A1S5_ARTFL|nr:hypothetical protein DFL_003412 [Arthrobotrys flagrans]
MDFRIPCPFYAVESNHGNNKKKQGGFLGLETIGAPAEYVVVQLYSSEISWDAWLREGIERGRKRHFKTKSSVQITSWSTTEPRVRDWNRNTMEIPTLEIT